MATKTSDALCPDGLTDCILNTEIDALRAENGRLKAKLTERDSWLTNWYKAATERAIRIEQLEDENERLRAALQEILDHPAPSAVAYVARDALAHHKRA